MRKSQREAALPDAHASPDRQGRFPKGAVKTLPAGGALYRAVYEALRQGIADSVWKPGDLLPSEAAIGARYGVSRITVRHALQLLQFEGYIRTQRAHRAIVLSRDPLLQGGSRSDTIRDIIETATDFQLDVESWRREPAEDVATLLGAPSGKPLHCLRATLVLDGHRLGRTIIYFHPSVGEKLSAESFDDPVVFRGLQRKLGLSIGDVKMTVWAEIASEEDVRQLGCAPGSAMLCSRIVYSDGEKRPFEATYARYPAALRRYTFDIEANQG